MNALLHSICFIFLSTSLSFIHANDNLKDYYLNGLKQAKYYLINGQVPEAELTLDRLQLYESSLSPIHLRYSAITNFLQGDYFESRKNFEKIYNFGKQNRRYWVPKICELHLLTLFITDTNPAIIKRYWEDCQEVSSTRGLTPSSWIQVLLDVRLKTNVSELNNPLQTLDDDELFSVLKLALYLDASHRFVDQLNILQDKDLADPNLRELIAEIYYRNNKLVEALESLRGLETPNALVIRADVSILQNKYELAYATLKKAFQIKDYATAVVKRIIPLAVLLDQNSELEKYLDQYTRFNGITTDVESLAAYIYYIQDKPQKAISFLNKVEEKRNLSFEEVALRTFAAYNAKSDRAYESSYKLCQLKSSYCWLPILDAYQLKRTKTRTVSNEKPFDRFFNLKDEGSLSEQEDVFIDVELLDEKQQFLEYLSSRK